MIVYGGMGQNQQIKNEIYVYNIDNKTFTYIQFDKSKILFNVGNISGRFGHRMIHDKDKLLIFGGQTNDIDDHPFKNILVLNINSLKELI
jgi:N-acetylneuraminic acid mutarotase